MIKHYSLENNIKKPIGVFDSGYGGLSLLKEFVKKLPEYDYLYLGDNARTPYGNRSFETVYEFTLQSVEKLFLLKVNVSTKCFIINEIH